ncbi:hypothetical protein L7F22_008714 [Adiantum nelumboides]|nr:hypothetical protein [Adiantum nelumboides]
MPQQKQDRQRVKAPYEANELPTHEKSHIRDEVLAQILAHIFIAKFKDAEGDNIKTTIMPREIWTLHRKPEVANPIRAVHLEQFFRMPPWGTDYMRAHELMSSIQYDEKAMITDKDGVKNQVLITTDIVNQALHLYSRTHDLIAKTKSIDNEKAFLKAKGSKYKYSDMIYSELELLLRKKVLADARAAKEAAKKLAQKMATEEARKARLEKAKALQEERRRLEAEQKAQEEAAAAQGAQAKKEKEVVDLTGTIEHLKKIEREKHIEEQRAAQLAREKIKEALKRKADEPILEPREGNPKKPRVIDVRPGTVDVAEVVDVAGPSTRTAAARPVLPIAEQARWDVKDAQAHALIALSVKRTITPHIRSAKSAKQAWDILAGLYAGRNEAKIALLRKELESKIMNEEDDMDTFLASIKDINEQLISAGEIISDSSLVQIVLDVLPDSYQTFASTWRLMNQRNPDVVKFDEVCTLLLQEALSRKNRSRQRAVEQAFIAAQRRGGNSIAATSHGSSTSGKSPVPNASSTSSLSRNFGDKGKKKMRCHYCKANDHLIKQCPKLKAKEAKKKEGGSTTNAAIVVSSVKEDFDADAKWAFSAECTYNPAVHDAYMSVAADSHVWYFDSGATKHITSHRDLH